MMQGDFDLGRVLAGIFAVVTLSIPAAFVINRYRLLELLHRSFRAARPIPQRDRNRERR